MSYFLVTGANGFIGNILCRRLLDEGQSLRVLVRKQVEYLVADQIIFDLLRDDIDPELLSGVDTVIYLAGYAHDVGNQVNSKHLYQEINVNAAIRLARAASISGIKRFVYISSVKAGGVPAVGQCASEADDSQPIGIYASTKKEAEQKLLAIGQETGLRVSVIRPALVYGGNVKGNLKSMLLGIKSGWFPPLPNTRNVRSMVHVSDLVTAILLAARKEEAVDEIFIVTDGIRYSSRDIYNDMRKALARKPVNWFVPRFIFYVLAKVGDLIGRFIYFPFDSYKYRKLLLDDCYNSDKIRKKLGFISIYDFSDAIVEMVKES